MGDKATLRMARQELEDLYLGVPDDSVDLTFKDLPASSSATSLSFNAATTVAPADDGDDEDKRKKQKTAFVRSSTNIFTYKLESGDHDVDDGGGKLQLADHQFVVPAGLDLPPSSPPPHHHQQQQQQQHRVDDHDDDDDDGGGGGQYHHHHQKQQHRGYVVAAAAAGNNITTSSSRTTVVGEAAGGRRSRGFVGDNNTSRANYKRPGIPHSNICALCTNYVYHFRHRCLVCGRVYCRRCVGTGMGEMTEGRKCIDCLGRRYSHRYIHKAGRRLTNGWCCCCFWGYYPNAKVVKAQELIWAEKGPAPRRRPRPSSSSTSMSTSTSYGGAGAYYSSNTIASTSMSLTMSSKNNMMMTMNGRNSTIRPLAPATAASTSSSFVAPFSPNPHAFPL